MIPGIFAIAESGVRDLLDDHASLAVWEQLRVARRALDLRSVATRCAVEPADAIRALDRLTSAGLAERVTTTHRGGVRWKPSCDRIVIAFDPDERAEAEALSARLEAARVSRASDVVSRFRVRTPERARSCRCRIAATVRLEPEDLAEFARRIQSVEDFLSLVSKRASKGMRSAPAYSNHAVHMSVDPISGPVLPQPEIEILPRADAERRSTELRRNAGIRGLSCREHDVATALSHGLTRPQVAQALGISANTVGTLSTRIYRKLGVSTRLQLVHAMRALGCDDGPGRGAR